MSEKQKPDQDKQEDGADQHVSIMGMSIRRSGDDEEDQTIPLWLITFADIMALMLTFFVLLYSMSTPEVEKWESLTSAINQGFSKFYSQPRHAGAQDTINIEKLDFSRALNLNYLKTLLEEVVSQDDRLDQTKLILQHDRLIVSLPEDLLFESGQDDVQPRAQQAIFAIADVLSRIRNRVEIIGHTDPRPITNPELGISSNWELSLARAASVAEVLKNAGYDKNMIIRGLSSARYYELPEDLPEDQRLSYARRVDIVIMKDDGTGRLNLIMGSG